MPTQIQPQPVEIRPRQALTVTPAQFDIAPEVQDALAILQSATGDTSDPAEFAAAHASPQGLSAVDAAALALYKDGLWRGVQARLDDPAFCQSVADLLAAQSDPVQVADPPVMVDGNAIKQPAVKLP